MRRWAALAVLLSGCARQSPDALYQEAKALYDRGKPKEALQSIERAIAREPSWRFRLLQAELLMGAGQTGEALGLLDATPGPSSAEDRARAAMLRGQAEFRRSEFTRAGAALAEAEALAKQVSSPLLDAQIAFRRGNLSMRQGRPAEAEQLFRGALKIANEQGNQRLALSLTGNLGWMLSEMHRYDSAVYWLEQARAGFERLGAESDVARAAGNLGWCLYRLGDVERGEAYLRQAEAQARADGNRDDQQLWLCDLAAILVDNDDFHGAAKAYREALAAARDVKDRYWIQHWAKNLANVLIESGDLDEAERSNQEAAHLEVNLAAEKSNPQPDLFVRLNAARIEAGRGNTAKALEMYRVMLAQPSDDPTPVLDAHSFHAQLLASTGDAAAADREYRATITEIANRQAVLVRDEFRLTFLSSLMHLCDEYVDFLVTHGQNTRALEVTESVRGRVLNERMASGRGAESAPSVEALEHAAGASGSVFLSYWLGPLHSYLWVIQPLGVKLHVLPPAKQIANLVEGYRSFLENLRDPIESEYPAGRQLSEILLGPVRGELHSGAKIVIAPDRNLHSLNFEALPDPANPKRYLIEQVRISVAPSLTLIAAPRGQPSLSAQSGLIPSNTNHGQLLLMGDPEPIGKEYPRLPNAAREMELVAQSYAPGQQVAIDGTRAVPAAYLESSPGRFSAIHFAAHATANRESPLDSALILSPSPSGYALTARQVMSVPLQASLVTLSACRSAGAKTYSGEGLVGLSWAFLRAGAGAVVAGLWDVTDMSTANLMGDFYAQMATGVVPADALRSAKLKLVHSSGAYRKPFYWAPFQLYIGRAEPRP
jgi:CHAT domain-containing protein/tetratricopeptide (TPR) repeat protein